MPALSLIRVYWKEAIAYRAEFLISLFVVPLRFLIIVMIWSAVYLNSGDASIQGYSLASMITYFMISALVSSFVYDTVAEELEHEIKKGNFLVYLLKPINYIWLSFVKKIANRAFALLIEIIPLLLIFVIFFRRFFVFGNFGLLAISLISAFIISFLIYLIIGILAFWFVNIRAFSWLVNFGIGFASGMFAPLDLFPAAARAAFDILPFQYIAYVPTSLYLGNIESGGRVAYLILMQLFWCVTLFVIAYLVWRRALKHFSGVGA